MFSYNTALWVEADFDFDLCIYLCQSFIVYGGGEGVGGVQVGENGVRGCHTERMLRWPRGTASKQYGVIVNCIEHRVHSSNHVCVSRFPSPQDEKKAAAATSSIEYCKSSGFGHHQEVEHHSDASAWAFAAFTLFRR